MEPNQDETGHGALRENAGIDPAKDEHVPAPAGHGEPQQDEHDSAQTPGKGSGNWGRPEILSLIFDGIVAVATVIGIYFLVDQSEKTEAALKEARESNRIAQEATARAIEDAKQEDARYSEQFRVAQENVAAAVSAAKAAQQSVQISMETSRRSREAFISDTRPWLLVKAATAHRVPVSGTADAEVLASLDLQNF